MDQWTRLMRVVNEEGIWLEERQFPRTREGIRGCYYHDWRRDLDVVVLDKTLRGPERNCVLAEELGHHFTAPRAQFAGPRFCTGVVLGEDSYYWANVSKDEARAFRWAANFLTPVEAVREKMRYLRWDWQLAEEFQVPVPFMRRRVQLLRSTCGFAGLGSN